MPVYEVKDYRPGLFLRNAHINTFYPYFVRKTPDPNYQRARLDTEDGDFVDVDIIRNGNKKACFLLHGLEGSSQSQYILALSQWFSEEGYDVYALNFRGCSGEVNRTMHMYHSGFTDDPKMVINHYGDAYDELYIVGYSLGGNVTLKYLGEDPRQVHPKMVKAAAISTPTNLSAGSQELKKPKCWFYEQNFLKSLFVKVKEKHAQFPDQVDLSVLKKINSIWEYDEHITSRWHGFDGAEDYYAKCASMQFIQDIQTETLIINSIDDPFLAKDWHPFSDAKAKKNIHFLPSAYGGHVGFTTIGQERYWNEKKVISFFGGQGIK